MADLSGCKTEGFQGSIALPFTVLRHPTVTGPVTLAISNLPPEVSYSFSPSSLTFASWAIGASSTLTLTASAGIQIPDTVIQIELADESIHENFGLLVHGTCPRQNKNFIMRGVFRCNNRGFVEPLANAEVEFYRYRSLRSDDLLGSTVTDADRSYETSRWAWDEADYYARLRLNDPGKVYLIEAVNSSVWSKDTDHKSNKDPVIDFGQYTIFRDGGQGTPKCAIWQGAEHVYREFHNTVGQDPPIGNYEILMWKTIQTPYSFLSTTNWPDNYETGDFLGRRPKGSDLFLDYETSFHEFGHTIRHTYDGD